MKPLKNIIKDYSITLFHEGKHLAEIKSLKLAVELLRGARKIALLYYFSVVNFILFAAGIFVIVSQGLSQIQNEGRVYLDNILIFGLIMATICGLVSAWLLSERHWISAFNIESYIQKALEESPDNGSAEFHEPAASAGFNRNVESNTRDRSAQRPLVHGEGSNSVSP